MDPVVKLDSIRILSFPPELNKSFYQIWYYPWPLTDIWNQVEIEATGSLAT